MKQQIGILTLLVILFVLGACTGGKIIPKNFKTESELSFGPEQPSIEYGLENFIVKRKARRQAQISFNP